MLLTLLKNQRMMINHLNKKFTTNLTHLRSIKSKNY